MDGRPPSQVQRHHPPVSPAVLVDMARMQWALEKLVQAVNVDAAWESPDATQLDAISFGEWLDRKKRYPTLAR